MDFKGPPLDQEQSFASINDSIHGLDTFGSVKGARSWRGWVRSHRWATAGLAALAVCCLVVVVVAPVCATGHCGTKKVAAYKEDTSGPLTLIVRFNQAQIDALSVVPALLHQFTDRLHLNSSSLQILTFTEEAVLEEARKYLEAHPDLDLLVRDFSMTVNPGVSRNDTLLQSILDSVAPGTTVPSAAQQALDAAMLAAAAANVTAAAAAAAAAGFNVTASDSADASGGRRLKQLLGGALGASVTINDPYFATQWHHTKIKTPLAWSASTGAPYIIVAVIDTGVDLNHPDLKNNLWTNKKEIPGNGIDDDGNGYVDDVYGYDFAGACLNNVKAPSGFCVTCVGQPNPQPFLDGRESAPHGTHVAGLIAAIQNNNIGVSGVAPQVLIMTLKVESCVASRGFPTSAIVSAFDYAYRMGAHIVSCSFGPQPYTQEYPLAPASVPGSSWYDPMQAQYTATYMAAIQPLTNKNVLVVAAAGNEQVDLDHFTQMGYFYGPCNLPLSNILCVAATGDVDQFMSIWSNYGANTVGIAAPGLNIFSTWLMTAGASQGATPQSYGTFSGTSQATPLVTGTAALVLATLASVDGNMFRATQLKSLIMNSGDYLPALVTRTSSHSRLNTANAVLAALQVAAVCGVTTVSPSSFNPTSASVLSAGLTEQWFSGAKAGSFSGGVLSPVDTSVRSGPSTTFPTFKYGAGYLLHATAMVYLSANGEYGIQATTSLATSNILLQMSGATLSLNSNGVALFIASSAGYYNFDLWVTSPTSALTLTWKVPGSMTFQPLNAFYISTPSVHMVPAFAQNLTLAQGYQVHYTPSTAALGVNVLSTLNSATAHTNSAVLSDLNFAAGSFKAALFPGGTSANMATGVASTFLKSDGYANQGPMAFQVTCKGCSLTLNNLKIVDNWDSNTAGAPLTKTSGCVTLVNWQMYNLTVLFAPSDLASSPMQLTMGPCSGGVSVGPYTSVAARTATPIFWNPKASQTAGAIGGLQCDVWRNATLGVAGSAPTFKVRLPITTSMNQLLTDSTTMQATFTPDSILPGLAAAYPASRGALFSVRCWTYWSVNPGTAKLTAPVSGAMQSTIYLSGRKVGGTSTGTILQSTPSTTLLPSGALQLLAVEWTGMTSTSQLSLQLGGAPITINLSLMTLPLMIVPDLVGPMRQWRSPWLGGVGSFSTSYAPSGVDVPGLIQNDMTEFANTGYVSSGTAGLSGPVAYSRALSGKTRYALSDGFMQLQEEVASATYTMKVSDLAGHASTLMFGNVTVKNMAPFIAASTTPTAYTFQMWMPTWPLTPTDWVSTFYAYAYMIVKTATPGSSVTFGLDILAPADAVGPMDTSIWTRTAWDPSS